MPDLVRYKVPVLWQWETQGPRWTWLWVREGTSDEDVLAEIVEQDVYHLRGLELPGPQFDPIDARYRPVPPLIVDIGANTGIFTVMCAAQFPHAEVWAVEPDPKNLRVLHRNVEPLSRRATVFPVAVGAHAGDVPWAGADAQAHVVPDGPNGVNRVTGPTVQQVTLADLAPTERRIALLKIDVEGAEYGIIGAATTSLLDRVDRIVMEWHGRQEAPWRDNWPIGALVEKLQHTHSCQIIGHPDRGGMIYAHHA